jgi:predicted transcriptional regulator
MDTKHEVLEVLDQLGDEVTLDDVILELQNRASIRRGFDELSRGEGISHEEVKARLAAWRESSGHPKRADG